MYGIRNSYPSTAVRSLGCWDNDIFETAVTEENNYCDDEKYQYGTDEVVYQLNGIVFIALDWMKIVAYIVCHCI